MTPIKYTGYFDRCHGLFIDFTGVEQYTDTVTPDTDGFILSIYYTLLYFYITFYIIIGVKVSNMAEHIENTAFFVTPNIDTEHFSKVSRCQICKRKEPESRLNSCLKLMHILQMYVFSLLQ